MVELRDLKWAIVASQHRSLRRAAEVLNVRQSTLSRRLRDMEDRVGARLFERTNGGTSPTVAGQEFLLSAHHILTATEVALSRLHARSEGRSGRLAVGVYSSLSTGNMFATLLEHHKSYPDIETQIIDGGREELTCHLSSRYADLVIMTNRTNGWDDCILPLWSERVVVAMHVEHPLAKLKNIRWPDLSRHPILVTQNGVGPELKRLINARLASHGPQRLLHQVSGLDRLLSMVATEHGLLLMLEGATGLRCDNVVYNEVQDDDGPTRLEFAAYWRGSNDNPALLPFLALLRRRYPDLAAMARSVES